MELDILKVATNGGGIAVCLALVILFLRFTATQIENHASTIKTLNDSQSATIKTLNEVHQIVIKDVTSTFTERIDVLTDKVFDVADKTTTAVNDLRDVIQNLEAKIK